MHAWLEPRDPSLAPLPGSHPREKLTQAYAQDTQLQDRVTDKDGSEIGLRTVTPHSRERARESCEQASERETERKSVREVLLTFKK